MTGPAPFPPRSVRRADPRVALLAAALTAVAALVALAIASAPSSTGAAARADRRIALVVDAGARPDAALASAGAAAARTERAGAATVAVRLPRTPTEAASDVRYFAAQGFDTVVAVGPLARRAARAPGAMRAVTPPAVPRTLR